MRYGGEASNEFNQGYEVNQAMMADELALTAYELKSICAMLKCHPDFERGNSIVHYAYHKVSDVINKLEGL